jgi:hypothetical protein
MAGGIDMNWQHLQTLIWLRWRLRSNQRRRASRLALMVQGAITVLAGLAAALAFVIALLIGLFPMRNASSDAVMYLWDGVVAGFLLFWTTELMVELQRSELLSMEKLLHLPVSLSGAFIINYLSSFVTPSIIFLLPAMLGLAMGMVFSRGPSMLVLFPLVAGLVLLVTALTHQFRGWLASLMENKRRRRTVIALTTFAFVLLFQIPNLLNFTGVWGDSDDRRSARQETRRLERALKAGEMTQDEYRRRMHSIEEEREIREQETENVIRLANRIVPLGWLPYGAKAAVEGRPQPALLATFGLALAAAISLRRSYRTTLRLYTGQFSSGTARYGLRGHRPRLQPADSRPNTGSARAGAAFLEKRLPWISEQASVVALASFRSLTRAPETKTLLLSPIMLVLVFGSMFWRNNPDPNEFLRPVMASGIMTVVLLTLISVAGNQFGFDRSGFRTFVLTAAPRRDILLGKNVALLPIALALGIIPIVALQIAYPMRFDHLIAVVTQHISMFLVFSIVSNYISILAPMAVAPGSFKPAKPKGISILIHIAAFFVLPTALATTLLPLAVEFLATWSGAFPRVPAYLVLSVVELLIVGRLYPLFLDIQGRMFQQREQKILEVVTAKVE